MEQVLSHLLTGGLSSIAHSVFGWLGKRDDYKHSERMEEIAIKETEAETKKDIAVAAQATKTAVAKGELGIRRASYHLGDVGQSLPSGVKLPKWAGGLLAISAFLNGLIHFFILLGAGIGTWRHGESVWSHVLIGAVGWAFGSHVSISAGLSATGSMAEDALKAWGVYPAKAADAINKLVDKTKEDDK